MTCRECGKEFPPVDLTPICWECWWGIGPEALPDEWTESAENEPDAPADKFEQRDSSQLVKPRGKCVNIDGWDV